MRLFILLLVCLACRPVLAGPPVYRCETAGKIAYSDAPCVGGKTVDILPTEGADKLSGQSRKSLDLQLKQVYRANDDAWRPLTGKSRDEMEVLRRRVKLSGADQAECRDLDGRLADLEQSAVGASAKAKAQADVDLYMARKRYFDLRC